MPELPRLHSVGRCEKCGSFVTWGTPARYRSPSTRYERATNEVVNVPEHIERECQCCGHTWMEECFRA